MRNCFLLIVGMAFLLNSCLATEELQQGFADGQVHDSVRFVEIDELLIKDANGKWVYKGKAKIYKDHISFIPKQQGAESVIPNDDIHTVYALYRGGASMLTYVAAGVSLGWMLIENPRSSTREGGFASDTYYFLSLPLGAAFLTIRYGSLPILAGGLLLNKNVPIYQKDTSKTEFNYFEIVDALRKRSELERRP